MKNSKTYEATDKMIDLIRDNYNILQSLSAFGIPLGFGDRTVEETCRRARVDTATFLAVVNLTINGIAPPISAIEGKENKEGVESMTVMPSLQSLLHYLDACHRYFIDYQLPSVRRELSESIQSADEIGRLILRVYDEYAQEIRRHMRYEERTLFPYIEKLMRGETSTNYSIELFAKQHAEADKSLKELKQLIIKYLPADIHNSHRLTSALYLIYNNEEWLANHQNVEDRILVPLIRGMEQRLKLDRVQSAIHHAADSSSEGKEGREEISEREKEVITAVVQGMSNKQIAEHLCISPHTVVTHRKNIARKLQIHSPAGLTIYAIVNGLVRI
ncbi:MAG: helix-turn-helix transcriptional regulator [Bacteroidaceae bacterium]|nr:helix-turn-helix transcriptional regulator [Bacteroidaceae bacterium]